jgi:glycolate oxidase iron-sulfur subunit
MEALLPRTQGGFWKARVPRFTAASGERRLRVALLTGCVQAQFFGETNRATARVLAANGCDVVVPEEQACCGALHVHIGDPATARALARRNISAFEASGADLYAVNAAGCGSTLKEYGTLLADEERWAERAKAFSEKMLDITELLDSVGLRPPAGEFRHRVAYHDACHLAHGQKVRGQPRSVLAQVPGLELVPLADSDTCCGSAGTYNITHPEEATRILEWKVDAIKASGADVIAAGNPGCIIQIQLGIRQRGLAVEVMHPVDILDKAYRATSQRVGGRH